MREAKSKLLQKSQASLLRSCVVRHGGSLFSLQGEEDEKMPCEFIKQQNTLK
jgi:hypothetical protein